MPLNYLGLLGAGSGVPYGSPAPSGGTPGRIDYIGSYRNPPAGGAPVLAGSPAFNYDPRFGGIPGVPSPGATQQQAIGGNISALGPLYNLGSSLNQFTAQQAPTSLNLNLPNYGAMTQTSSGNILSKLRGQIPQDVVNQLGQLAAERGVSTGSIGSPNANAALLSALGQTSLGLQNIGEQQLTQAIGRTPQGAQFNPSGFLVTPEQQQEAQYQANLLNAAPVPSSAQFAGLNALQSGRQSGFSQFPTSAPSLQTPYTSPYSAGLPPLGGINPRTTGGTAYSGSIQEQTGLPNLPYWQNPNQFQFDTGLPSGTPSDWQTGMPLPGYAGPEWGGGAYPTAPYYEPSPVSDAFGSFPIGGDVVMGEPSGGFDFTSDIDWGNLFGDAGP